MRDESDMKLEGANWLWQEIDCCIASTLLSICSMNSPALVKLTRYYDT